MSFFLTGTDTGVGKTVTCAWLLLHYHYSYWKPIQSGMDFPDTETVKEITGFDKSFFFSPAYELQQPLSPHESAKRDGIKIDLADINLPKKNTKIIVEGAGGVLVPINEREYLADVMMVLEIPILLVARSGLGTINHTLLSVRELKRRNLPVIGIILNGEKNPHNKNAIEKYSRVPVVAELDFMSMVNKKTLLSYKPGEKLDDVITSAR